MSQRDYLHDPVRQALVKDGWTITHDPYTIAFGNRRGYIDLGAERQFAAEKQGRRIAVEVKSFLGESVMVDLEQAVGQYLLYRSWMARLDEKRELFLAVSSRVYRDVFEDPSAQVLVADYKIQLVSVAVDRQEVDRWFP
jgi:hypothetical protein